MSKFRQKRVIHCPEYLLYRENQLSGKTSLFQNSSLLLSNRLKYAKCLYSKDLYGHYGCINAIEFSLDGRYLISGGDDRYVQLWNVNQAISSQAPIRMKTQHQSNVFCLAFDSINSKILSAGNDGQIISHDTKTGEILDVFLQEMALYGLSICPNNDSLFASAGEDGKIKVFDIKSRSADPTLVAHSYNSFHAVQFHPLTTNLIISANNAEGVILWDMRKPKQPYLRYGDRSCKEAMSVKFNHDGSKVLALVRRNTPMLFETTTTNLQAVFDADYYYNSCTMKSCCFAGADDEFILSGSDDFNLYMWKIPEIQTDDDDDVTSNAQMVLKGHRSIVNQVRFNKNNFLIASSGVEKIIKLWSPMPLPECNGGLSSSDEQKAGRKFYNQREYLTRFGDIGRSFSNELGSTVEDMSMLAFFDALVYREISDIHSPWPLSDETSSSDELSSPSESHYTPSSHNRTSVSETEDESVDGILPKLIARRRRKLNAKLKVDKKLCKRGYRPPQPQLSGLTTANSLRFIYDPTSNDTERISLLNCTPNLSFRRRTVAPYTVMQNDSSSQSSENDSDSSSDDVYQPTTSRIDTDRNKSTKRASVFDYSSDEECPSPNAKRRAVAASPEVGPKYSDDDISSDDQILNYDKSIGNRTANGVDNCSSSQSAACCQGNGCSSKCKIFVPISSMSDEDDEPQPAIGTTRNAIEHKENGSSSSHIAESGPSNSAGPSSSGSHPPKSSTVQSRRIKFSINKAKSARKRSYRRQK